MNFSRIFDISLQLCRPTQNEDKLSLGSTYQIGMSIQKKKPFNFKYKWILVHCVFRIKILRTKGNENHSFYAFTIVVPGVVGDDYFISLSMKSPSK